MADSTKSQHWVARALRAAGAVAVKSIQFLLATISGATGRPSAPTQLPDAPRQRPDEYRP